MSKDLRLRGCLTGRLYADDQPPCGLGAVYNGMAGTQAEQGFAR